MTKLLVLVSALAMFSFSACGGSKAPATTTTTATAPAEKGGLELGELEFFEGNEQMGLKLRADGRVEVKQDDTGKEEWKTLAMLSADGKLVHDGKMLGQLTPEGAVLDETGATLPVSLEGDALLVDGKRITLDDQGIVQGANPMPRPARISGATTVGLRRTALYLLAVMMAKKGTATPAH